jgi:hypothetical protein
MNSLLLIIPLVILVILLTLLLILPICIITLMSDIKNKGSDKE